MDEQLESWKGFKAVVGTMNQTVESLKSHKEMSQQARKTLLETTKSFKKVVKAAESKESSAVDALTSQAKVVVKAYQEEIDRLTKRCKATEQSYTSVFSTLQQFPDPVSAVTDLNDKVHSQQRQMDKLLQTVDKLTQELESAQSDQNNQGMNNEDREELIQLRKEVTEYEMEFRNLKNQDITIRKLEEKIVELQTDGAETLQKSVEQAREEFALTEGRRVAEALEREASMEAKVRSLEVQLKAERGSREATENVILQETEGLSRREAAWEVQRQIIVDDYQRVQEQLQTALQENEQLKMRVSASPISTSAPPSVAGMQDLLLERNAYQAEVAELSSTNNLLREDISTKDKKLFVLEQEKKTVVDTLEREKVSFRERLESLEMQLSSAPNQTEVDQMKRELRILKRLEYNVDDVDTDRDPEIAKEENDLESVLVSKLRLSEKELINERNSMAELQKKTESLKKQVVDAEKAKDEAHTLVKSLERDLEAAIKPRRADGPRRESSASLPTENPDTLQNILDPDAPSVPAPKKTEQTTEKEQDDHSVATIVMAQRDRLRVRCEALEAERDSFKRELQAQVQAAESVKTDNAKLYEKVRYLQNFGKSQAVQHRDLDLEALEQRYEASVDPFKQFSKAERQRKLKEMSPMERIVFIVAKTFLSTKETRFGLVVYVVTMHLLVFVTTYHWSHAGATCHSDNEHLSHLPPNIQEILSAKAGN